MRVVGRDVAPSEQRELFLVQDAPDQCLDDVPLGGIARQKHQTRAVVPGSGQREAQCLRFLPQEAIRHLDQDAGAIARVGFAAARAAMQQVDEQLERLARRSRCDGRPLMSTTKPTPQESCSNCGS